MESGKRTTYLDAIRILAELFVIFNHVAGRDMRLFSGVSGAVALFLFYISKSAIPLFLMVSGAVLLSREEPYARTLRRAGRIVLLLALVTLLHYGADCLTNRTPFLLSEYIDSLYHGKASDSLWYLYAYLGWLIMLPILQRLTPALGRRDYRYFAFWTLLITGGMPILRFFFPPLTTNGWFALPLFAGIIGLPVMGLYINGEAGVSGRRTLLYVLLPVCVTAACAAYTTYDNAAFPMFDSAFLLPSMLCALSIFYLMKRLDTRVRLSDRTRDSISQVAKLVLCAYLLSDFAIERLQFIREALVPTFRTNGAGLIYTLLVFIVCMLLSAGLTRIPILRKIL